MLTQNKKFEGKLVEASLEPAYRQWVEPVTPTAANPFPQKTVTLTKATRFKLVVDEMDDVIGAVSDKYTLILNKDLISAVDLAADELGIRLEVESATYHNGHSRYYLRTPNMRFRPDGDGSYTEGQIVIDNDYRGNGGIRIMTGWFRLICSNGQIIGQIASQSNTRHVGEIDILKTVKRALEQYTGAFEANQLLAETLAIAYFNPSNGWAGDRATAQALVEDASKDGGKPYLIDEIAADTADRYQKPLQDAVVRYGEELGGNLWALAQAVSDVATHEMNGRFAPDDWATRQLNRIEAAIIR